MDVLNSILSAISDVLTQIWSLLGEVFTGVVQIFYTPGVGEAAGELTFLGQVIAFVGGATLAAAAIYIIYHMIRNAISGVSRGVRAVG